MRSVRRLALAAAALAIVVPVALVIASPSGADTLISGPTTLTTNGTISAGMPYSSGQPINIDVAANSTLALSNLENFGYSGEPKIDILECADPYGTTANDPTREIGECDGQTLGSTTDLNADGSFTVNNYQVYALPDAPTFGESATGVPACGDTAATECVLYIGTDPADFAQPYVLSAPFSVAANAADDGSGPGDGQLAPLTAQTITYTSTAPDPGVEGGTYNVTTDGGGGSGNPVVLTLDGASTGCSLAGAAVTFTGAGTCLVDANQAANNVDGTDYAPATQAQQSMPVVTGYTPQAITITSTAPAPGNVGNTYAVSATGGASGSAIVYSIDSSSTAGACSVSSNSVHLTGTGTCVVDANQAGGYVGGVLYSAAPQKSQSFPIVEPNGAAITTANSSIPAATVGSEYSSFTFTAQGGEMPYKWKLVSAKTSLPKGMKFSHGILSGTPKSGKHADTPGNYTFEISVATKKFKEGSGHSKTTIDSVVTDATYTLTLDS